MSDTESRVLDTLAAMNLASLEQVTGLDPQTTVLVRFAAVALDAAPLSYLTHLTIGQEAGINSEQVEDVLLALAPLVGSARVVSAGSTIAGALGIAVLGAEARRRAVTIAGIDASGRPGERSVDRAGSGGPRRMRTRGGVTRRGSDRSTQ